MKVSPIQLMQATIEKISVEINGNYTSSLEDYSNENIELQFKDSCSPLPEFWEKKSQLDEGVADRTFVVKLGIRTVPEESSNIPYFFEFVFSGVVACIPESVGNSPPEKMAREYGLAMLYGSIREQFLTMTSRMEYGPRMLPTVSFMDSESRPKVEVLDSGKEK